MELSERNFQRYKDLFEKGVVSRIEYETKESEYKRLKANYDAANAMLNRTKANVSSVDISKSSDDLKNANALLLSAKADLQKATINLNYAIISTPIDGVVISRNVEVGQTVAATFSTPVLFTIANDLTKMEIEASIDEADVGMIKVGQSVVFTVDAYVDETFEGRVEQIRLQPQVVANVVTYTAIVSTNNEGLKLMPGMTANLDIMTSRRKDVLRVPVMALNFTPPDEYIEPWRTYLEGAMLVKSSASKMKNGVIWKVEDNTLVPKKIEVGLSDGSFTEIVSDDFVNGDQVVVGLNTSGKSKDATTNPFLPSRPGGKKE
jgi:HlyD family secretion protein